MKLPPPSVKYTRLPASTKGLLDCVRNEIGVIEDELEGCYNSNDEGTTTTESLEDAIDDGFMCVDLRVLERKLQAWHSLFSPAFLAEKEYNYTVTPCFAVKCNPDPSVVEWLARSASRLNLPLGFDCASIAELQLAKSQIEKYSLKERARGNNTSCSVPTTRIVYANPQRAEADLMRALELFSTASNESSSREELWLTLDGVEEVYKIAMAQKQFLEKHDTVCMPRVRVILRIWVPDGHSQVPLGEKFGMRLDQIEALVGACLEHGIDHRDIIGVSFHCGSGCESVETYLEALEMGRAALAAMNQKLAAASIGTEVVPRCWLLDIGGGFPGLDGLNGDEGRFAAAVPTEVEATAEEEKKETEAPQSTTVADIAGAVRPVLQALSDGTAPNIDVPLTLIAEPGRYFVEGAIALASRIYQKQMIAPPGNGNENEIVRVYRIPHGVQGVFKDVLLCGESFVPQPLQTEGSSAPTNENAQPPLYPSRVLGPSGDDAEDIVCESCLLPELRVGDWLVFDRMGAYTLSIASRAGRPVMRYVLGGSQEDDDR